MESSEQHESSSKLERFLDILKNTEKLDLVSAISKFPVPIAIFSDSAIFLAVNQRFADIYESDAMYLLGKKFNELSTVVYAHFTAATAHFNQDPYLDDIENEFYSKGHFYIVYFRALRTYDKKISSIIVVCADITRLKRRERVLIQNNKKLHDQLYIDQITGLKSKLALEQFIAEKCVGSMRDQYSFIKIDLDDFKKFNQMNSYTYGDEILCKIGRFFNEEILHDVAEIYRMNSASFVVVVEDSTPWKVLTLAERLRQKMVKSHIAFQAQQDEMLTATFGIIHPTVSDQFAELDIMEQLNVAIKHAKFQGKNSIFVLE